MRKQTEKKRERNAQEMHTNRPASTFAHGNTENP